MLCCIVNTVVAEGVKHALIFVSCPTTPFNHDCNHNTAHLQFPITFIKRFLITFINAFIKHSKQI